MCGSLDAVELFRAGASHVLFVQDADDLAKEGRPNNNNEHQQSKGGERVVRPDGSRVCKFDMKAQSRKRLRAWLVGRGTPNTERPRLHSP